MSTSQSHLSLVSEPFPNELVWGWLGRFRERYVGISHDALAEVIGTLPSYRKAFPTRLARLAEVAGLSADKIVDQNTCHRFVAMELTAADAQALRESLLHSNAPVKVPTRWTPRPGCTLRVCRRCVDDDLKKYGTSYYRCEHQIDDVLECPHHGGTGLISTKVPVGVRDYVPPQEAMIGCQEPRQFGSAAGIVAKAYAYAMTQKAWTKEQVLPVLEKVLSAHGYLCGDQVHLGLRSLIEGNHDGVLDLPFEWPTGLKEWVTIPHTALACSALKIDWHEFLAESAKVGIQAPQSAPLTAHLRDLLERVRADARDEAVNLRQTSKKVTVWALATALSKRYGINFASNYGWRPEFRTVLLAHTKVS
jgi:hypothetical protein